MNNLGFSYAPGEALLVCGPNLAILACLEPTDPLVTDLVEAVGAPGNGVDELLELLIRPGLRAITDFAVVGSADDTQRVVVRGRYRVEVDGADPLVGRGVWSDHTLPADVAITVTVHDVVDTPLRLVHGVALAACVRPFSIDSPSAEIALAKRAIADETASDAAPNCIPQTPVDADEPGGEFDALFDVERTRSAAALALGEQAALQASEPVTTSVAGHTMPSAQTAVLAGGVPSPDEPLAVAPPVAVPTNVGSRPTFIDSFPWETEDAVLPPVPAPPRLPQPAPAPRTTPDATSQPAAAGMTIKRANLRMPTGGGIHVMAVCCARGHSNAPYASVCRACAAPVPPQQPISIQRPPLGVLRLDKGGTVLLDRAVIMGRNPRVPSGYTGEQPNLVQLPDPERDISSQHLEVRLDDWHVVVRDLGSTNGTQVILPGEPPLTLRPNDPLTIESGTRVLLASVFGFTFEVEG